MAYKSQPTVTRPANTTAYTAGDVVGGVIQFDGIANAVSMIVTTVDLRIDVAAIPTGMTSFRLHLYDATPASALADNAVWDLTAGDRANYMGYVDMGSPADVGSTLYCRVDQVNAQIKTGNTGLYAYLVTNGGFTPAGNSEVYAPCIRAVATD